MRSDSLRNVAIAIMLAGVLLASGSTSAFSSVTAERTATVDVAQDPDGLLGMNARTDTLTITGKDSPQPVATLRNNMSESIDIDVWIETIPSASDSILRASTEAVSLATGETTTARVECAQATSVGQKDVVFGADAIGPSASIENATFIVTIDVDCSKGGGQAESSPSGLAGVDVTDIGTSGSESQTISFDLTADLEAGETVTIELQKVQHQNKLDYSGASETTTAPGSVSGSTSGQNYVLEFSPNQSLSRGDSVSIGVSGIDASGKHATKKPYSVTFERSDQNGTEETVFNATSG